jgi:hypothetical protein
LSCGWNGRLRTRWGRCNHFRGNWSAVLGASCESAPAAFSTTATAATNPVTLGVGSTIAHTHDPPFPDAHPHDPSVSDADINTHPQP